VDLHPHDPRILRQVETYFRDRNVARGRFKHYRPATRLREQASLIPKIGPVTLTRAEQLFTRLNDLFP
jgi:hypothetical protein